MRTTVDIDDGLMRKAKQLAVATNRSLRQVMEDALRAAVARTKPGARKQVVLPVSTCKGGVRPGVNLDSMADLLRVMDEDDAAA